MTKEEILNPYIKAVREICKNINISEEEILQRARLLFILNKINFWNEFPIIMDFIKHEREKVINKYIK